MPYNGLQELTTALTRTFAPHRPTIHEDVTDKGESISLFVIPHPTEPRYAVTAEAKETRGNLICALWFGSVEIAKAIPADQIAAAMEEILSDRIVAVVKYKNRDTYDDRHPSGWQKLFQITDDRDNDEGALASLLARLETPPTFIDRLPGGIGAGVFEVARWSGVRLIERVGRFS